MNFDARKYVIISFFIITGLMYGIKLFYMQVVDVETWKLEAQRIAEQRREITPPRAVVFDRNGNKVVENKTYYNLMMVEEDMIDFDTVAFGKLVGMTKNEVLARIEEIKEGEGEYFNPHTKKKQTNYQRIRPYPFLKELTTSEIAQIAPHLKDFPGFFEEVTSMRNYPYASGANILGYLAEVTQAEIDRDNFYKPAYKIGRAGIESFYEEEFRGKKGVKYIIKSARQNTVGSFEDGKYDTTAVQSKGIILGLDIDLQAYGEKLMENKKGCIVAIEPSTGEILAMVSAPTYDPNLLVGRKNINKYYPALVNDENKPLFPRPLASEYMPGSTFKPVQALIGMQEGVIQPDTGFPCNKSIVGCHNHAYANSVTEAVKHSCNPYFYAVSRRIIQQGKSKSSFEDSKIGIDIWAKYMHSFGLGRKLKTDITGLRAGNIPDSKYYDRTRGEGVWKFSAIQSISIGQGEVQLTPLQLANVAAIMANRGWFYTPHFVKSINGKGPRPEYEEKNYTMVESKYFPYVVEGMRRCVHEPGGTAPLARIPGIMTCGKTGTVENFKLLNGRLIKKPNHSVFIAFAPMDNPKIAIAVFVENTGGGGGTWAAPIASLVIEKYLNGEVKSEAKEKRILDAKLSLGMRKNESITGSFDWVLFGLYIVLVVFGVSTIYSVAYNPENPSIFSFDEIYGRQIMWVGVSLFLGLLVFLIDSDIYRKFSIPIYLFCLSLLVIVLFMPPIHGARAWLGIGPFGIQPGEFAKIGTAILLSNYMSSFNVKQQNGQTVLVSLAIIAVPMLLIMLQPDAGTFVVFTAFFFVMYREGLTFDPIVLRIVNAIPGVKFRSTWLGTHFIPILFVVVFLFVITLIIGHKPLLFDAYPTEEFSGYWRMFAALLTTAIIGYLIMRWLFAKRDARRAFIITILGFATSVLLTATVHATFKSLPSHQKTRIELWLGIYEAEEGTGNVVDGADYNRFRAMTAVGSGGFSGKGYREANVANVKTNHVPECETDFIFSPWAEERGFMGSIFLVIIYMFMLLRIIAIAERQRSKYNRVYAYSVAMILFYHFAVNVGMNIGLVPIIGIPLPLFSYGGSSMMAFSIMIFLLLKLDSQRKDVLN